MTALTLAPGPGGAGRQGAPRPGSARPVQPPPAVPLGPGAAIERVLWVAPGGSDTAPGTQHAPFATVDHARQQAQALLPTMAGDVVIVLRGGRYTCASTLCLGAADSGTGGHTVRYVAAAGEEPLISSAVPITGWRQETAPPGGWLWSAPLPASLAALPQPAPRQLWVNGRRARRVRGPWPSGAGALARTASGFSFTSGSNPLASWRNPQSIELVYRIQWMEQRLGVAGVSSSAIAMQDADSVPWTAAVTMFGTTYAPGGPSGSVPPDFIEHAYELLDAATTGQFWVDSAAQRIYYVPRPGEVLAEASVLAPTLERLLSLDGVSGVSIEGLTFSEAGWLGVNQTGLAEVGGNLYFSTGSALEQFLASSQLDEALDPFVSVLPCALSAHACHELRVRDCTFRGLGGGGLALSGPLGIAPPPGAGDCTGCTIERCSFEDCSAGALTLNASNQAANTVRACTAHDCNLEYSGGDGIAIFSGAGTLVAHNHVYNMPYIGLRVDRGGGLVEHNLVHDVMQTLVDGGPLYSYGQTNGLVLRRNVARSLRAFYPGGFLYTDGDSSHKTWQNNVVAGASASGVPTFFANPALGDVVYSYNFSDAATQSVAGGISLLAMNRLSGPSAPAPASVLGTAGPAAPPRAQCTAPRGLSVLSSDPAQASVVLAWSVPAGGEAAFYEITSGALVLGTTPGTTFTFADLAPGVSYVFRVAAADSGGGLSVASAPLLWTAPAQTTPRSSYGSGWE